MIELKGWGYLTPKNEIQWEDGTTVPLTTDIVYFHDKHKKFPGKKMSEVYDVGYLQWMQKAMEDDHFVQALVKMRIKELT